MATNNPYYSPTYQRNLTPERINAMGDAGRARISPMERPSDIPNNNPWISAGISTGINAIAGGVDMFNSTQDAINEYRDMEIQMPETEIGGIPSYGGVSDVRQQYSSINPNDAGKGLIGQGALTGAQVGMGLMAVNPIVGGIATGAGALIGGIAGLFGKNKARKEADKAKKEAKRKFVAGQNEYNADVEDYFESVDTTRADIQGGQNRQERMYGLNQYNDPFRSIV